MATTEYELFKVKIIIRKHILQATDQHKYWLRVTKSNIYPSLPKSHSHNTAHLKYQENKMSTICRKVNENETGRNGCGRREE